MGVIFGRDLFELDSYLIFNQYYIKYAFFLPTQVYVKFKIEGDQVLFLGTCDRKRFYTTKNNECKYYHGISLANLQTHTEIVLMFDFGNVGDGTADSTFYYDDIYQTDPSGGLSQMDLPVTFEDPSVYYVLTDFGGNGPSTILETVDGNYARVEKNSGAEHSWSYYRFWSWFLNNIPTNTDTKMFVHVYVSGTTQTEFL